MTTFAESLRQLRQAAGLTQQQLAEKAGVQNLQICRYELGKAQPMLDVTQRLCQALGCSADELIFGQRAPQQATSSQLTAIGQLSPAAQEHINQTLAALIGWYRSKEQKK